VPRPDPGPEAPQVDAFDAVRVKAAASKATLAGRLRRDQVDLLRAGVVFTSSGLDAVCHRLVRDTALPLIERGGGAKAQFDAYLKDQLTQARAPDGLLDAVTSPDPRIALIDRYIAAELSLLELPKEAQTSASVSGTFLGSRSRRCPIPA